MSERGRRLRDHAVEPQPRDRGKRYCVPDSPDVSLICHHQGPPPLACLWACLSGWEREQAGLLAILGRLYAMGDGSFQPLQPEQHPTSKLPGAAPLCFTGLEHVACEGILDVQFINLDRSKDRANWMNFTIETAKRNDKFNMVRSVSRFRAVEANCTEGRPDIACEVSSYAPLNSNEVAQIEDPAIKHRPYKERAGLLGCWSSHVLALQRFAQQPPSEHGGARWLLLLEDDVYLSPQIFARLPFILSRMPTNSPWHVARIDTWGEFRTRDSVGPSFQIDSSQKAAVYFSARHLRPKRVWQNGHRVASRYYMGTHAVLVQWEHAASVAEHLVRTGASSPDMHGYQWRAGEQEDVDFKPYVIRATPHLAVPRKDLSNAIDHRQAAASVFVPVVA